MVNKDYRNLITSLPTEGAPLLHTTRPCILPGSLNRVPALSATSPGLQVTLCDPIWHVSSSIRWCGDFGQRTAILLNLLVSWLSGCYSYVKWYQAWSCMFRVDFGVRQGSVLSPYLFSIYMDDLAKLCQYNRGMFIVMQMTFYYLHPLVENFSFCYKNVKLS